MERDNMKTVNYRNEKELIKILASSVRWGWLLATVTAAVVFVLTLLVLREVGYGAVTRYNYFDALTAAVVVWCVIYGAMVGGFRYGVRIIYAANEDKEAEYNNWKGEYPPLPHQPEWVSIRKEDGQIVYKLKEHVMGQGGKIDNIHGKG